MMEKNLNEQQLDRLIRDWTDDRLDEHLDKEITDCLTEFAEDDLEIDADNVDIENLIDMHIHHLAMEEHAERLRKWKVIASCAAAVTIAIMTVAALFFTTNEYGHKTNEKILVVESQVEDLPIVDSPGSRHAATEADSSKTESSKAVIKPIPEASPTTTHTGHRILTAKLPDTPPEHILSETFAEINNGIVGFTDDVQESLDMQTLSIIESNLIETLQEIKSLNITLNFETSL